MPFSYGEYSGQAQRDNRGHWMMGADNRTVAAGQASDDIIVPYKDQGTAVVVNPGGGATATVEYTMSPIADIIAGTAVWFTWSEGGVTAATNKVFHSGVTGVRLSSTGGSTDWFVTQ